MDMDPILAVIAIIFGILVIVFKDLLNWIVGIALILVGLYLLYDYWDKSKTKTTSQPPPPTKDEKK